MTGYAIAQLHRPDVLHDDVLHYMTRIQSTLDPFDGRFLVHGGEKEVYEGDWPEDIVIIAFPTAAKAREWYHSPAYRELLPLRTDHLTGATAILEGVGPDYDAAATASTIRRIQETPA